MSDKLEVMVIPFQDNASVLLPRNLVEYVLPYAMPLPSSYNHSALVGSIIYQNEKVPMVDLGILYRGNARHEESGQRRIVIVSCTHLHEEFSSYALIADSAPRMLELSKDLIQETIDELQAPFYSRVELAKLEDHQLFVLDVNALESEVFE